MNKQIEDTRFSDMCKSGKKSDEPVWASKVRTHIASATGQLPRHSKDLTWKAFAGVGFIPTSSVRSTTLQLLASRQKKVRGEA